MILTLPQPDAPPASDRGHRLSLSADRIDLLAEITAVTFGEVRAGADEIELDGNRRPQAPCGKTT